MTDIDQRQVPLGRYIADMKKVADLLEYLLDTAETLRDLEPQPALAKFWSHIPLVFELFFQRLVDNFLNYVSELLAFIFATRPEMLKSEDKLSYQEALEYATRDELIAALTERKVVALSFKGLKELNDELGKKYALALFTTDADLERASILVEKRNLITHNRGYINRRYLDRVPLAAEKFGDRLIFTHKYVLEEHLFLNKVVQELHNRAMEKFFD